VPEGTGMVGNRRELAGAKDNLTLQTFYL